MKSVLTYFFGFTFLFSYSQSAIIEDINGNTQEYVLSSGVFPPPAYALDNAFHSKNLFPLNNKETNNFFPKGGVVCLNVDTDNELEILVHNKNKIHAVNTDGSIVSGWSITIPFNENIEWVPSIGDITGNGKKDIVFASTNDTIGKIYAFDMDGNILPGFPYITSPKLFIPVLADINNNKTMDIFVGINNGGSQLISINGFGDIKPGFPVNLSGKIASHVAVGDINKDGYGEIIIETENKLWAIDHLGIVLNGFPYTLNSGINEIFSYSSPLLVDIDNDGFHEILCASHEEKKGYVYVFKMDGSLLNGWPIQTDHWILAPLQVANLDAEDDLEIIIGDFNQCFDPKSNIYTYKKDGSLLHQAGGFFGVTAINVVDVDQDTYPDIVFNSNNQKGLEGYIGALTKDLQLVAGWPKNIVGNSVFSYPTFANINQNLHIISSNTDFISNTSFVELWESSMVYDEPTTPFFLVNEQHNGYIENKALVSIEENKEQNESLNIFPNPSKDIFTITSNEKIGEISIASMDGKILYNEKVNSNKTSINLSNYPNGVYLLFTSNSKNTHKKLIKL